MTEPKEGTLDWYRREYPKLAAKNIKIEVHLEAEQAHAAEWKRRYDAVMTRRRAQMQNVENLQRDNEALRLRIQQLAEGPLAVKLEDMRANLTNALLRAHIAESTIEKLTEHPGKMEDVIHRYHVRRESEVEPSRFD